ncbi:hypothetical protein BASA61_005153 [Batrachochytrium salamandrivorans]|nr:hypothetical protein BASA61_005153 [Batrachochytrium salamandrivorans]
MQLFYLLSFVVVVSHAAALPQPAELSDKYSSNVDITLASGLEARSYQPELNSQGLCYFGVTETTRRFWRKWWWIRPTSPPLLTYEDIQDIIDSFFKDSDFTLRIYLYDRQSQRWCCWFLQGRRKGWKRRLVVLLDGC